MLIVILGVRAYSVAETHFRDMRDIVFYGLDAQGMLVQMESLPVNAESLVLDRVHLQAKLAGIYPDLVPLAGRLETLEDVKHLKSELRLRSEKRWKKAHSAASGLLRVIGLALLVAIGVTGWLVFLLYRGLIQPLERLKEATSRIREGDLSCRVGQNQGVAELRELSRSFNLMALRLETLDQAKTEFLATVSHEVKNPLAALKEGLNFVTVQGDAISPTLRKRALDACCIASKRLEAMFNNLLKLSRGESGLYEFDLSRKNLADALRFAADEVRPMADKRRMEVQISSPADLQASFNWDGMVQVFVNLLLNAIKYGQEGTTIEVRARVAERPLGESDQATAVPHVEVSVVNAGKEISKNEVGKIFEKFYRGNNSNSKQGLGIGLHVVKRIIEAHHGRITAQSAAGLTRMDLTIPGAYESHSAQRGQGSPAAQAGCFPMEGAGATPGEVTI